MALKAAQFRPGSGHDVKRKGGLKMSPPFLYLQQCRSELHDLFVGLLEVIHLGKNRIFEARRISDEGVC